MVVHKSGVAEKYVKMMQDVYEDRETVMVCSVLVTNGRGEIKSGINSELPLLCNSDLQVDR